MKKILELIAEQFGPAFAACGYDMGYAKITLSNRPDLCEYQCNGAMAAAKAYKKKPIDIANEVTEKVKDCSMFSEVNAVMPGFINIKLSPEFLADYLNGMASDEKLGYELGRIRRPSFWTTAEPTWPSRCTWDICGRPSSARA